MRYMPHVFALVASASMAMASLAESASELPAASADMSWALRIPARDGTTLNGNAYRPRGPAKACLLNLSPYNLQGRRHATGMYFASHGYAFVLVDSRGRGDSAGTLRPFVQEGDVGHDTWLTIVSGRPVQERTFLDNDYWTARYREHFERGRAFLELQAVAGSRGDTFTEWALHPQLDDYWDAHVPSPRQYAALDVPILTITGSYDDDQTGALKFYRKHMRHGTPIATAAHHLIIGPWDHDGTVTPAASFGGLAFGAASLVDLNRLHLEWHDWTLNAGARPAFLKDRVAYYVTGAEEWRHAPTIEAVTAREQAFYLRSDGTAADVFGSGMLAAEQASSAASDSYVYDPRDVSVAALESADPDSRVDQRDACAGVGDRLVYHSRPFRRKTEISGTFRLTAWIAIDQPDTDFWISVHEITSDGRSVLLATDVRRARYRESLRRAQPIAPGTPLHYHFNSFTFVSREIAQGSRLRLVIGPGNSINKQKNYNSGRAVVEEAMRDARVVTVTLFHDATRPSALFVPLGQSAALATGPLTLAELRR